MSTETSDSARLFKMFRLQDESEISGTGHVIDGVIFHTGQVVICWRADLNKEHRGFSSLAIYPSWKAFLHVHVDPHPGNETLIEFPEEDAG